jgi:hypothetical protein
MGTMERLIDAEVTERGTILEKLEIVYAMTGFRLRLLVEHLGPTGPTAPSILSQGSEAEQGAPRRSPNNGQANRDSFPAKSGDPYRAGGTTPLLDSC